MPVVVMEDLSNMRAEVAAPIIAAALLDNEKLRDLFVNRLARVESQAADIEEAGGEEATWDDLVVHTCHAILVDFKAA